MSYSPEAHARCLEQLLGFIEQANASVPRTELPFILTNSGKQYRHGDPNPEDITIEDVAHSLSRMCRFTGHIDVPHYSVAQHSVLVSRHSDHADRLDGLLHDATEAYVADISSPFKRAPGMEVYKYYEDLTARAVSAKFGTKYPEPPSVRRADLILCLTEMRDLFEHPAPRKWALERSEEWGLPLLTKPIFAWSQRHSEEHFLARYQALTT